MIKLIKNLLAISLAMLPILSNAQSLSVEAKAEYETWSSGLGGQSTAPLGGLGLGYYKDKYFFGAGFVLGAYKIKGSDNSLKRTDVDAVVGYQLDDEWSVFAGYRFNKMEYTTDSDTSFDENTHGLGAGMMLTQNLNENWLGYATFALSGLVTTVEFKDGARDDDNGKGVSVNAEGGTIYRINSISDLAFRIKYQTSRLDYETTEWPHSYVRVGVSFSHRF